jgi:hypothetical protein
MASADRLTDELRSFIDSHPEWLIERVERPSFAARAEEIVFRPVDSEAVSVSFPSDMGVEHRVIDGFSSVDGEMSLDVFDLDDGSVESVRFIRRRSHSELRIDTERARVEFAARVASAFACRLGRYRVSRVTLSRDGGRFAEIFCEDAMGRRYAAVADLTGRLQPEFLLSTSLILCESLRLKKSNPVPRIGIIGGDRQVRTLRRLVASLSEEWKGRVDIYRLSDGTAAGDLEIEEADAAVPDAPSRKAPLEPAASASLRASASSARIIAADPAAIDVVRNRQGETLRFNGLPFARVRTVSDREMLWCGVSHSRVVEGLDGEMMLRDVITEIAERRSAESPDRRHEFFRAAPEAWLESLLRRDIKRLDANLVVSPVHEQFRAGRDRIDLLALRSDGRLVVIEVKVSQDREMVFQAVDYWRKVESMRLSGAFSGSALFGDAPIADRPALIYLVAPTLSFHPETDFLISTLSAQVGLCKFELTENWRSGIKVCRRTTYGLTSVDCD